MLSEIAIADMASRLREEIGVASDTAVGDIVAVVKEAGYKYAERHLDKDVPGFSRYLGSGRYEIGFNPDHYWNEGFRRFTIGHELGHVSIPRHRKILNGGDIHESKPVYYGRDDDVEREADRFAVHLLTPAPAFRKQMQYKEYCPETISALAKYFGTSVYATVLRYVELTDQSCALIVCNEKGQIRYEKRSPSMFDEYRGMRLLNRESLRRGTLVHDWVTGNKSEQQCRLGLEVWYDDCPEGIEATESVIFLGYGDLYFSLLIPDKQQVHDEEEW